MSDQAPSSRFRSAGPIVEVLVWAALLVGVWVTTLSSVATSEMAAAAGSALLCGVAAVLARRAMDGGWRPSPRWFGWMARLPVAVVVDTVRVLTLAVRHAGHRSRSVGRIERVALPADGSRARTSAREALGTLAVSMTPASFVFDVDEREGVLVVHSLVSGPPSMTGAVQR